MHLAPLLVSQPRALHPQLALGQRDHPALGAVPQHLATVATTLLRAGQLLGRQHQQLLDQRDGGVVHQLVDARLRPFEQFQHRQQRLAAAGQNPFDLRPVVAMHDFQRRLCLTILHGGFLFDGFRLASSILSNSPGNRRLKFQLRLGHRPLGHQFNPATGHTP